MPPSNRHLEPPLPILTGERRELTSPGCRTLLTFSGILTVRSASHSVSVFTVTELAYTATSKPFQKRSVRAESRGGLFKSTTLSCQTVCITFLGFRLRWVCCNLRSKARRRNATIIGRTVFPSRPFKDDAAEASRARTKISLLPGRRRPTRCGRPVNWIGLGPIRRVARMC